MPPTILIIEDDPVFAEQIKQSLLREGYSVSGIAVNLPTALESMKKHSPDLALIDIKLDGPEDGITTAKELLKLKWIPIIYITGDLLSKAVERSKSTFPAAFLEKPLRAKELSVQIEIALHNFNEGNLPSPAPSIAEQLFVLADKNYVRIKQSEILFIKADRIYANIFLTNSEFQRLYPRNNYRPVHASMNMGSIFQQLSMNFYRVSRSLVINSERIDRLGPKCIIMENHEITIPDGSRTALLTRLNIIKKK